MNIATKFDGAIDDDRATVLLPLENIDYVEVEIDNVKYLRISEKGFVNWNGIKKSELINMLKRPGIKRATMASELGVTDYILGQLFKKYFGTTKIRVVKGRI